MGTPDPKAGQRPLASILIPVYNRAGLIEATIRSALAQSYDPIEVVVVDNASTDATWEVLQRLALEDPRLRIFRNETNLGPVRNWRACAEHARGHYAKILWSDDLIEPSYLERCLPVLEQPGVGFVYTTARVFGDVNESRALIYRSLPAGVHASRRYVQGIFEDGDLPVSPGCAVLRRSDLLKNLLVDVPNPVGSDFAQHAIGNDLLIFLLTAADHPAFGVMAEPLSLFRAHQGSITSSTAPVRLVANYDLAKAYFAATRLGGDPALARLLDVYLHIHLRRYGEMPYGLRRVGDFYPGQAERRIPSAALLRVELRRFVRRITRRLRTRAQA